MLINYLSSRTKYVKQIKNNKFLDTVYIFICGDKSFRECDY